MDYDEAINPRFEQDGAAELSANGTRLKKKDRHMQ
jgi:hypothetical protein